MAGRLLRLGWRNLWRHPQRTSITMAAIALGYAMLLFVASLMAGLRWQIIENGTGVLMSQVQVHAPGYYPDRPAQKTLGGRAGAEVDAILAAILTDPRIVAAAPRVYGYGMVSAGHRSAGVELLGVRPEKEREVTTLAGQLMKGRYVTEESAREVVVGDTLARLIGVDVGAAVALLTHAADGSMRDDTYTVVGTVHTGVDAVDRRMVILPLLSLQGLLQLAPARIHEIGIKLNDATDAVAVAAELEVRLGKLLPVRARSWEELAPELSGYVQFNRGVTFILLCVFFVLAVIGVMNTMLMAVFERTRELGMLTALGMRPAQVIALVAAEAAGLAGAALLVGTALGIPLLWYLQAHGLDVGGATGEVSVAGVAVGNVWHGRQDFPVYARAAVGLAVTAMASALYPAWRAARFQPAAAIRKA